MASVVEANQAMRGVAFVTAVTFVAEIGDVRRFETPRPADGLCRSGALGALGRTRPTRQHYQSRQPKSPPCPHRGGLDVSLSGSPEPASASSTGEPPQVVRAIEVRLIQDCRRRQTLVLAALRSKELAAPANRHGAPRIACSTARAVQLR